MLDRLRENPKNPRNLNKEAFEKLKNKVKSFPEMLEKRPIVYDEDFIVLGGNQRLRVLKELVKEGFEVKDSYFMSAEGWSEEQKRQFVITDNVSDGEWDYEILGNEWDDLPLNDWGIDGISWDTDDVIEDEAPEVSVEPPVSKLGEIYQLGRHRIMCGDSTKIEDVEKLMNGQKADMVFTDPPYGMDLDTDYTKIRPTSEKAKQFAQAKGETTNKNYSKVIGDDSEWIFDRANHFECDEQFWWGADWYRRTLPQGGSWFVWDKRTNDDGSNLDEMFGSCFELCWSKTRHKREIARIKYASLFGTEREDVKQRLHPTQKPILLAKWFFDRYGKTDDIVVDLFLGSGSTLIACEQTDRTCYGMELDPKYCDVIRKRYHKFVTDSEEGWEEATPVIK